VKSGRTLGIAIEVPAPFGTRVDTARHRFEPGHHRMPAHITLIPPFDADEEAVLAIRQHCQLVAERHAPFTVRLRGTATFRPQSPVVFVPLSAGSEGCAALEGDLRTETLALTSRFPYHPHVTIAQTEDPQVLDQAEAEFADAQAEFLVGGFRLYEHRLDAWIPIGEHRLQG
jgi:2'-5' RNA ligase